MLLQTAGGQNVVCPVQKLVTTTLWHYHGMLPTASMKRVCSDTDARSYVGSSERLLIFSLSTSGAGARLQSDMLKRLMVSVIIFLRVMVIARLDLS